MAERTAGEAGHAAPRAEPAPETAIDPVCGMAIALRRQLHLDVGGERFYFCCDGCRATYAERQGAGDVAGA